VVVVVVPEEVLVEVLEVVEDDVEVVVEQYHGVATFPGSTSHPSLIRDTPAARVIKLSPAKLM